MTLFPSDWSISFSDVQWDFALGPVFVNHRKFPYTDEKLLVRIKQSVAMAEGVTVDFLQFQLFPKYNGKRSGGLDSSDAASAPDFEDQVWI